MPPIVARHCCDCTTFLVSFQQACTLGSSVEKSRSDLANLLFFSHSRVKVLSLWCECSIHSRFWPSCLFSMLPKHVHIATLFILKIQLSLAPLYFISPRYAEECPNLSDWFLSFKIHMSDGRAQCQQRTGEIGFLSSLALKPGDMKKAATGSPGASWC